MKRCETMNIRLAAQPTVDSIVDGEGLRTVFWCQGCLHHCPGCHNPATWDMSAGFIWTTDELVNFYLRQDLQSGITISGGDRMKVKSLWRKSELITEKFS